MHELLGKCITMNGSLYRVTMLRADKDHGIAEGWINKQPGYFLVRLSDQAVIRQVKINEDFDAAIIAAGKVPA